MSQMLPCTCSIYTQPCACSSPNCGLSSPCHASRRNRHPIVRCCSLIGNTIGKSRLSSIVRSDSCTVASDYCISPPASTVHLEQSSTVYERVTRRAAAGAAQALLQGPGAAVAAFLVLYDHAQPCSESMNEFDTQLIRWMPWSSRSTVWSYVAERISSTPRSLHIGSSSR